MKRSLLAAIAALSMSFSACGGSVPSKAELKAYKDGSCACKDAACAVAQVDVMKGLMERMQSNQEAATKLMQDEEADGYIRAARKCLSDVGGDDYRAAVKKARGDD